MAIDFHKNKKNCRVWLKYKYSYLYTGRKSKEYEQSCKIRFFGVYAVF